MSHRIQIIWRLVALSLTLACASCGGSSERMSDTSLAGEQGGAEDTNLAGEQGGAEGMGGVQAGEGGATSARYRELLRSYTEPLIGDQGGVGLMVVLVTPETTELLGLGVRARGGSPIDGQTVFQIGSVSKVITGLMFASMYQGSTSPFQLDDPVNEHLQGLVVPSVGGTEVTLEQLATHYSGLPNFPRNLMGPSWSPGLGYTRTLLDAYLSSPAYLSDASSAGESYLYSNLGYGLLGLALTDASGRSSYEALLEAHLITPLHLSRTGLNREGFLTRVADNIAQGHGPRMSGRAEVDYANMGVLAPSGEVFSSGEDVARFLRVMSGLEAHPVQGAVELAIEPRALGGMGKRIAFGWDVSEGASPTWSKSGLTPGFTAFVAFKRDPQVGVAILSNIAQHAEVRDAVFELIEVASTLP